LWADGLSASQIAAELGGITRNAVIGKVHRLGLSGRAKAPSSSVPRPRKARAPSHVFRSIRASMRGNTALAHAVAYEAEVEPEPEPLENVIPIGQRCSILELSDRRSRPGRLLLLRRQDHHRPALLRLSRPHRLPAGERPAPRPRPAVDARVRRSRPLPQLALRAATCGGG
jgi:hypothetical protein